MKRWLLLSIMAIFGLGAFFLSCDDDDDDDDCQCDDDDENTDDDNDNDSGTDDDDDDTFGAGPGSEQCLDDLKTPFTDCKAVCDEIEDWCEYYHCLYGCFDVLFTGAVACADLYPDLEGMRDYWECNAGCDETFIECVEPLDQCDLDVAMICLDELQTCEAQCVPGSLF